MKERRVVVVSMGCGMSKQYCFIIILGWGFCGGPSGFAGQGASRLDLVIQKVENGPQSFIPTVSEVIEMQPLLGPKKSNAEWIILYEPKDKLSIKKANGPVRDEWLEDMQKEEKLDEEFPGYGAMSACPQYTAVSRSPCLLVIGAVDDEDGTVSFVRNKKNDEIEPTCCDKLVYWLWLKNCLNL